MKWSEIIIALPEASPMKTTLPLKKHHGPFVSSPFNHLRIHREPHIISTSPVQAPSPPIEALLSAARTKWIVSAV